MIFTLILIAVLIIGISCLIISLNKDHFSLCAIVIMITLFSAISLLVVVCSIIEVNVNHDTDYQNMLYEKEMLEYRIDNISDNIVGNEMVYSDIVDFNNRLRVIKKWANNPWTNWLHNKDIADIDYVEIKVK